VQVSRIIRTKFGDYSLENMHTGEAVEVPLKGVLRKFKTSWKFPSQ